MAQSSSELTTIHLRRLATPGRKYYGDNEKIYIGMPNGHLRLLDDALSTNSSNSIYQNAVGSILTDTTTIDFTYNSSTPSIIADLKNTSVTAGVYGSSILSPQITIDAQGRITSAVDVAIASGAVPLPVNQIFVGDAVSVATAVAMSGEASILASGAVTLLNSAVIGKLITGYVSAPGVLAASDTILQAFNKLNGNIGALVTGVSSVNLLVGPVALTGTAARITVSAANIFDIDTNYIGQSSITTLGTITSGTWNGATVAYGYGGTNATTSWTQGSVIFAGATTLEQDNSELFWDNTNNRLGIGLAAPLAALHISKTPGANPTEARIQNLSSSAGSDSILTFWNTGRATVGMEIRLNRSAYSGVITMPSNDPLLIQTGIGNLAIGPTTPTAKLHISQTIQGTGAHIGLIYTGAVNQTQTLSTEIPAWRITTTGRQWATGDFALQREFIITAPTYTAVAASTITDGVTFAVTAPIASATMAITRIWAAQFTGNLAVSGSTYLGGLTTAPLSLLDVDGTMRIRPFTTAGIVHNDITTGLLSSSLIVNADITNTTIDLTTKVTGALPATNGGTGHTVYVIGDVLYASSTTALSRLAIGSDGQVLTLAAGIPSWAAAAGGGLTVGTTTITSGTATRILYNNAGVLGEYTITGTGTVAVMQTSPTFVTDITTPLLIGGTAVGSNLIYKSTTGAGTATGIAHQFTGGTNGATVSMTILNNGLIGIGTTTPDFLGIGVTQHNTLTIMGNATSGTSGMGILELASKVPDAASADAGVIDFMATSNTVSALRKRVAYIYSQTEGTTANDRGGRLIFATKPDAGAVTERMRITSDGNVGIGVTVPLSKLDVVASTSNSSFRAGTFEIQAYATNNNLICDNAYYDGASWTRRTTGFANIFQTTSGTFRFHTFASAASGTFSTANSDIRLEILVGGNVGIGMINSLAKLSVVQTVAATGVLKSLIVTGAINTNQTASTEIPNITFTNPGRQWATGAITLQREVLLTAPTYTAVGASVISDAVGLGVTAPVASTNVTITRNWAAQFTGNTATSGNIFAGGLTTATGARFHSIASGSTSATYSARFRNSTDAGDLAWVRDDGATNTLLAYWINGTRFLHSIGDATNVFIGTTTGSVTTTDNNVGIGTGALNLNQGGRGIAIGANSLGANVSGYDLIAIGQNALAANTTNNNVAVGQAALTTNTTGNQNVAVGNNALTLNLNTSNNNAFGHDALFNNVASQNCAFGTFALKSNTSGANNMAIGHTTLLANLTSSDNTALGAFAARDVTGANNTALGSNSMITSTTGANNTAVGQASGAINTTGSNNTYLGYATTSTATFTALTNSTAIGNEATIAASNVMQLGNTAVVAVYTRGNLIQRNPALSALVAGNTITVAQMVSGYITFTGGAGSITTPSATLIAGEIAGTAVRGTSLYLTIDNSAGSATVTLALDASITVNTPAITGGADLAVTTANSIGLFRIVFTSGTAAKIFRIH